MIDWYMFRLENINFGSPSDPWVPWSEAKSSHIHFIIRRRQGKAKLCILKITSVFHQLTQVGPKQMYALSILGGCTCDIDVFQVSSTGFYIKFCNSFDVYSKQISEVLNGETKIILRWRFKLYVPDIYTANNHTFF